MKFAKDNWFQIIIVIFLILFYFQFKDIKYSLEWIYNDIYKMENNLQKIESNTRKTR
jgi:hypothetical protein